MATVLDKELKRQVTVDGVDYTIVLDPDGLRLTGKGKRKPEVALRWHDLLSGDAAMALALNASLGSAHAAPKLPPQAAPARAAAPALVPAPAPASKRAPKKRTPAA